MMGWVSSELEVARSNLKRQKRKSTSEKIKKRTLKLVHNMINNHNTLKVKVQVLITYLFVQLWVYFAGCICRSPPLQTPERRCAEIFMRRSRCWPLGACLPGGGSDLSLVLNCPLAKNSLTCVRTYSWGWEAVRTKPPGDAHMSAGIGGDGSRRILPPPKKCCLHPEDFVFTFNS